MTFTYSFLCRFVGDSDDDWTEEVEAGGPDAAESYVKRMYNEGLFDYHSAQHRVEVKLLDSDDICKFVVYVEYDPTFTAYPLIGESNVQAE